MAGVVGMPYRWHFKRQNLAYVLQNFGSIVKPSWPRWLRPIGGLPAAMIFGNLYKPIMRRSRCSISEIERSYESFVDNFRHHFAGHDYLPGAWRPE